MAAASLGVIVRTKINEPNGEASPNDKDRSVILTGRIPTDRRNEKENESTGRRDATTND